MYTMQQNKNLRVLGATPFTNNLKAYCNCQNIFEKLRVCLRDAI